jgi:hypothetical protein
MHRPKMIVLTGLGYLSEQEAADAERRDCQAAEVSQGRHLRTSFPSSEGSVETNSWVESAGGGSKSVSPKPKERNGDGMFERIVEASEPCMSPE